MKVLGRNVTPQTIVAYLHYKTPITVPKRWRPTPRSALENKNWQSLQAGSLELRRIRRDLVLLEEDLDEFTSELADELAG